MGTVLYKQAKYTREKEIRVAKLNNSGKLRNQLSSSDPASVWKVMKDITNYKTPFPRTLENQQLTDDLNEFYCRFEKTPFTPPARQNSEDDVCQVFRKNKRRKAPGCPDGVTPACLKSCADQLAPIFTQIFNRSLELCGVPSCFKRSTLTPVPKTPNITGLNDLQTCGSNVCGHEIIWILVLAYLRDITGPPAVCLNSKQVCGWSSQHGTALRGGFSELGAPGKYWNGALYICTHLPRSTLRFFFGVMLAAAQYIFIYML